MADLADVAKAADPAAWPADALEVGRIGEPWGVKGWFKVRAYAAPAEALRAVRLWHLRPDEAGPAGADIPETLAIRAVRVHGDGLVASADAVDDRDGAARLRGARVFLGRSAFPPPGNDEYYWADLIGLAVVNRAGVALGSVAGLIDTGPQSTLRVVTADVERLIPFVSAYVDTVDVAGGRITVDWELDY